MLLGPQDCSRTCGRRWSKVLAQRSPPPSQSVTVVGVIEPGDIGNWENLPALSLSVTKCCADRTPPYPYRGPIQNPPIFPLFGHGIFVQNRPFSDIWHQTLPKRVDFRAFSDDTSIIAVEGVNTSLNISDSDTLWVHERYMKSEIFNFFFGGALSTSSEVKCCPIAEGG